MLQKAYIQVFEICMGDPSEGTKGFYKVELGVSLLFIILAMNNVHMKQGWKNLRVSC